MFKFQSYITYFKTFARLALTLLYYIPSSIAVSSPSLHIAPNTVICNADKIVVVQPKNKSSITTKKDNSFKHVFIKPGTVVHNSHLIQEQQPNTDQPIKPLNKTANTSKTKPTKNRKAKDLKTQEPVIQPANPNTPYTLLFKKGSCFCTLSPNPIKLDFSSAILAYTVKDDLSKHYQILYYNKPAPAAQQLHALYSFSLPPPHFLFA